MAIQNRRGAYANLDKTKLLPGEFAICTDNGKLYYCCSAGNVQEVVTIAGLQDIIGASREAYATLQELIANLDDSVLTGILNDISALQTNVEEQAEQIEQLSENGGVSNPATTTQLGSVKASDDVNVSQDGTMSVPKLDKLNKRDVELTFNMITTTDEASINSVYDNYDSNLQDKTRYKFYVQHNVEHSVLGGGTFYVEGVKHSNYGWQRATRYNNGYGLLCFERSRNNGVWTAWTKPLSKSDIVNNQSTTVTGFAVDATQLNRNIVGSFAYDTTHCEDGSSQIVEATTSTIAGKGIRLTKKNNTVKISGYITGSINSTQMHYFTIPVGFRPVIGTIYFPITSRAGATYGGTGFGAITTAGIFTARGTPGDEFYFNISYDI